jgi:hypothetical protein
LQKRARFCGFAGFDTEAMEKPLTVGEPVETAVIHKSKREVNEYGDKSGNRWKELGHQVIASKTRAIVNRKDAGDCKHARHGSYGSPP